MSTNDGMNLLRSNNITDSLELICCVKTRAVQTESNAQNQHNDKSKPTDKNDDKAKAKKSSSKIQKNKKSKNKCSKNCPYLNKENCVVKDDEKIQQNKNTKLNLTKKKEKETNEKVLEQNSNDQRKKCTQCCNKNNFGAKSILKIKKAVFAKEPPIIFVVSKVNDCFENF